MRFRIASLVSVLVLVAMMGSGCGPKAFTKGEYDDPNRVELLDDKFGENDLQQMAKAVVDKIVSCPHVANAPKPPVLMVDRLVNRTEEHIDTKAITEYISQQLLDSGKVEFSDKDARDTLQDEYKYQAGGNVSGPTAKKAGDQIGADYLLKGQIATNIQEVGNDKFVYYLMTMQLTSISKNTIACMQKKEIRKKYRKRSVGL